MIEAAKANVVSAQAELARAQPNYERYKKMVATNVVGKSDYDQVEATLRKAEAEVTRTQAALTAEQGQLVVLTAPIASRPTPSWRRPRPRSRLAKNDLDNTVIRAPVDGVVGNKGVQVGQYVKAGTQLMAVVPLPQVYVVANFKETQLEQHAAGPAGRDRRRRLSEPQADRHGRELRAGERRRVQPAAAGERHRQLHQGGAAGAGAHRRAERTTRSPACCGRACRSRSASIRAPAAPARPWPAPSSAPPRRRRPATRPPPAQTVRRLISDG